MRVAISQMCSGISPDANALTLKTCVDKASVGGASIIFTPEMTGLMDRDRARAAKNIYTENNDPVLLTAKKAAADAGIWVALGSLALRPEDRSNDRWVNRSLLIDPGGEIAARYDKIHLFDVDLGSGESQRESAAYAPGDQAKVAKLPDAILGLSICYDVRFAGLYEALTNAGAKILAIPAAFTAPTGKAHWEVLLRARAIESGSYVIASAQCGKHEDGRTTHGHAMIVDPWGKIMVDMQDKIGVALCDLDLGKVDEVRRQIPAVANRREFSPPRDMVLRKRVPETKGDTE